MLKLAAIGMLSLSVLTMGVVASSSCVVVDIKTGDGPRIILPVPLAAARVAMAVAPEEARRVEVPELAEYSELARRLVEELRDSADAVLVEVDDKDEHVFIEKIGDELVIDVVSGEEDVLVHLPLEALAEMIESHEDGVLDVPRALSALGNVSGGDLVHVKTADAEVKIWVW